MVTYCLNRIQNYNASMKRGRRPTDNQMKKKSRHVKNGIGTPEKITYSTVSNCGLFVLQMRKRIPYILSVAGQRLNFRPRPRSILPRTCLLFLPLVALLALPPAISLLRRSALQSAFRQAKQAPCSARDAVPRPHACRCRCQAWQATGGRRRRVRSIIVIGT